jgi:hypothetical protein
MKTNFHFYESLIFNIWLNNKIFNILDEKKFKWKDAQPT